MDFSSTIEPVKGFRTPELQDEPSLELRHVSDENTVLLDPETVFWAVSPRNEGVEKSLARKALPLFKEQQKELQKEFTDFRNKIDLSAVYINATDRCNGNCPYCYIPKEERENGRHMDPDDLHSALKKILDYHNEFLSEKGTKPVIVFHGSEPLMVKETLFKAIDTFSPEMLFGIQTNATFLEKDDVAFLKKHKVSVGISLDSSNEEKNSNARPMGDGTNAYDAAIKGIKWFEGYKGLSVITTVTKHNLDFLSETIKLLHSLKVQSVLMNPVRCTAEGTEVLRPDNTELFNAFKGAVETTLEINSKSDHKIMISDFANIILAIIAPTARRLMCDVTPCGGGRRFFTLMSDMTTAPCGEFIGLKEFHTVSLKDHSVEEVLQSKSFKRVRDRVVEVIPGCKECLYKNICGAPCPAEVHTVTGDLNNASPYCEYYKLLIDYGFDLIAKGQVENLIRPDMFKGMETVYNMEEEKK